METMKSMTQEQIEEVRREFGSDPIFRMMYRPLLAQTKGWGIAPEEVWAKAVKCVRELKDCNEMLYSKKLASIHVNLWIEVGLHKSMLIMTAVFFMLLNAHPTIEGHPYINLCCKIKNAIRSTKGFAQLYEDCRREEDAMEARGEAIPVKDYTNI